MGEGATTGKGESSTPSRPHNPAPCNIPSICRIGKGYNLVTKQKQKISVDKADKVCYHVYNGKGQPEPLTPVPLQPNTIHTGLPIEVNPGKPGQIHKAMTPTCNAQRGTRAEVAETGTGSKSP